MMWWVNDCSGLAAVHRWSINTRSCGGVLGLGAVALDVGGDDVGVVCGAATQALDVTLGVHGHA